jgi:hypothetical protein
MKDETKVKQIVVRFDKPSYYSINEHAKLEHRGLGEFVRHATLNYIESHDKTKLHAKERGNNQP